MQFKVLTLLDGAFILKAGTKRRSTRTAINTERERYAFSPHLFIALYARISNHGTGPGLPKHGFFVDRGDQYVRFRIKFPT